MLFPTIVEISYRLSGRKRWQILRRRCFRGILRRKRYHFLRRIGYRPHAEQEKMANPARKVLRGGSRQKKVSFSAQNGIPPAFRAEKQPNSCADGAPGRLRAETGIISCAEEDTHRLPSRKTPKFLRGGCSGAAPSRKRRQNLRGMGYRPPAGQKNTQIPAQKVLRGGSGQKKGGFFEIVAAMCRSYHNFLYFCALYNLKTLKNYVTYCRLRFY